MKLVRALLAGIGTVKIPVSQTGNESERAVLPEACDVLPEELQGILEFIGEGFMEGSLSENRKMAFV